MRPMLAVAICLMAWGCQGASNGDPIDAGADAGTDAVVEMTPDAAEDPGTDGGPMECNALTNIGEVVTQMYVATDPVEGTGGDIGVGTYVLIAAAVYTGPGGMAGATGTTYTDTLVIADAGMYERVASVMSPGMGGTFHQNGHITTDGASLDVTQTCPPGEQPFTSFDSDGTTIRIYAAAGALGPGAPGVMFEYERR